ncbi:MAG: S-methyl-5-thioribose-1-phosphate isomerase [Candidatus Aenigmarchaeota archaeon]|nr:S-methyl-5-thioribose-1-phosphate isomerase [Candidatus Aenigmarchaeota archaeon]
MKVGGKDYRTVWMSGSSVNFIEQNKLPFSFEIYEARTHADTCMAIKTMIVRGAGAIGASAGYGMAQAFLESDENMKYVDEAKRCLEATRPTAQNLFYAANRVYNSAAGSKKPARTALEEAQRIADEDAENCMRIGENGNMLIEDGFRIETHCNAGWLAFVDFGSALSPVYVAHRSGKNVFVYADETRPRSQGARLTAWELRNEGVPHAIIPDNAGAHCMSRGMVDMMIVGADRIAANGDTANKIGTYERAICAARFGVPFYVAAPTSTFDLDCETGDAIPIEERSEDEVLYQTGPDEEGVMRKVLVCSPGSGALNPAFDVTPAELITGIITEKGIIKPSEEAVRSLFS